MTCAVAIQVLQQTANVLKIQQPWHHVCVRGWHIQPYTVHAISAQCLRSTCACENT
jgi:hypothetical protein